MAWTAELISKEKDTTNGNVIVVIEFTDSVTGAKTQRKTFGFDLTNDIIAAFVKANISVLETRDSAFDLIITGNVTPKDSTPPASTQFFLERNKMFALKQLVDCGVINAQTDFNAQVDKVNLMYDKSFIGL